MPESHNSVVLTSPELPGDIIVQILDSLDDPEQLQLCRLVRRPCLSIVALGAQMRQSVFPQVSHAFCSLVDNAMELQYAPDLWVYGYSELSVSTPLHRSLSIHTRYEQFKHFVWTHRFCTTAWERIPSLSEKTLDEVMQVYGHPSYVQRFGNVLLTPHFSFTGAGFDNELAFTILQRTANESSRSGTKGTPILSYFQPIDRTSRINSVETTRKLVLLVRAPGMPRDYLRYYNSIAL